MRVQVLWAMKNDDRLLSNYSNYSFAPLFRADALYFTCTLWWRLFNLLTPLITNPQYYPPQPLSIRFDMFAVKKCWCLSKLLAIFLSVIQATLADRDICLFMPYVSSIKSISKQSQAQNIHLINIDFELNYQHSIRMSNLRLNMANPDRPIWEPGQVTFKLLYSTSQPITYRYDFTGLHTKDQYTRTLDGYYKFHKLDTELKPAIIVAGLCSFAHIYKTGHNMTDATNNTVASLLYRNSMTCILSIGQDGGLVLAPGRISPYESFTTRVTSVAVFDQFRFSFTGEGRLVIERFAPGKGPKLPPGNVFGEVLQGSTFVFPLSPNDKLLANDICNFNIDNVKKRLGDVLYDEAFGQLRPIETFTSWPTGGNDAYLFFESGGRTTI